MASLMICMFPFQEETAKYTSEIEKLQKELDELQQQLRNASSNASSKCVFFYLLYEKYIEAFIQT